MSQTIHATSSENQGQGDLIAKSGASFVGTAAKGQLEHAFDRDNHMIAACNGKGKELANSMAKYQGNSDIRLFPVRRQTRAWQICRCELII